MTADPCPSMTFEDLCWIASIDTRMHDGEMSRTAPGIVRPCPGCADRCGQCDDGALD